MTSPSTSRSRWRNFPWIGVLGAIIVFLSWVFQNQFANTAVDERLRCDRSQLAIDLQQIRMEMWTIFYLQEKARQEANTKNLTVSAFKTLQARLNLIAWTSGPCVADYDVAPKDEVERAIEARYRAGNLRDLEEDLRLETALENNLGWSDKYAQAFRERYQAISEKEKLFTLLFIFTYVIGSAMIGIDFMLKLQGAPEKEAKKHR